jgi:hypothetical protein
MKTSANRPAVPATLALPPAVPVPAAGDAPVALSQAAVTGARDFDFLYGKWKAKNRRLPGRLQNSNEWVEFEATTEVEPLPGGIGNLDIYRSDYWPDFVGVCLRVFNPATRQWSIYWVDNHNAPGVVSPPVTGSFENGVGVFESAEEFNGKPILVRYLWKVQGRNAARWEQAFSPDNGKSWETNWIMDFTRIDD